MSDFHNHVITRMAILAVAVNLSQPLLAGESGQMTREIWLNLPGSNLSDFTSSPRYWQAADTVSAFAGSAAPSNAADNFASRVRAYITAPVTGDYTFWISSDDDSALYLSTTASKFDRNMIASISGWVNPQQWDVKASQKSATIHLEAGQSYFIEALHKEGYGADHLAIAWQIPGGSRELVPASALEPFTADPNDADNDGLRDDWETAHGFSPTDNGTVNPSEHPLADPDHDGYSNLEEFEYGTNPTQRGGVPGSLYLETWTGIGGLRLQDLTWNPRFTGSPNLSEFVFTAATPVNRADNYGARLRGYIIAPTTGAYTFHLAGDDYCELWLSSSESQFAKTRIAAVDGYTSVSQWTKYSSQKSQTISLVAGQKYYVEALLKEAGGGDHLEIGWKKPGADSIEIIPGSALESYAYDADDVDGDNLPDTWELAHGLDPLRNDAAEDLDQDGISNALEYANGCDPLVKSSIPGGLLTELWLGIPGYSVQALKDSPKFLQNPDKVFLITSTQTGSQPYDAFGYRARGYITAPATGAYTFWVQGDDETELWLSNSASPFDKQLLVRPTLNTSSFDTDISQKSRSVQLTAGQRYYVEILHKDYYSGDFCQVAWTKPGAAREIIPGSVLSSFAPVAADQDDDGLLDAWETANGLDPHDNGRFNPANGANGDLDGDGLANLAESKAGTRADLADTDGDGVNDREEIEVLATQALVPDVQPFESVAVITGDAYAESSPGWTRQDGKALQDCVRGWLDYPVILAADGQYAAELEFTPVAGGASFPDYDIVFSVDGNRVGRQTASATTSAGHAHILLPWLSAGTHTLRVYVDNSHYVRRISVDRVTVLAARGTDANGNNVPDWVDLRLLQSNSIEAPSESLTSPICIEGKAKWSSLAVVSGASVSTAPDDRWFTNVNLDPTQPTDITASLENGAIVSSRQVTWAPTNLLAVDTLSVRQGDSLRLSAWQGDTPTPEESVTLDVEGVTATSDATQPVIHAFTTPGAIPVQITHVFDGITTVRTVTVSVLAAPTLDVPVCVPGFFREVTIPGLPAGVDFHADSRVETRGVVTGSTGDTIRTLRLTSLDDRTGVFRVDGSAGPILGTVTFKAMRVRSGRETALFYSAELGNNSYEITSPIIVDGLNPGIKLRYDIFIGGVVFDDGTLQKNILVPDDLILPPSLENTGDYTLKFLKAGLSGSNCHRVSVWQGSLRIAYFE